MNQTDSDFISEERRAKVYCLELGSGGEVGRQCLDFEVKENDKVTEGPIVIVNSFDDSAIPAHNV